jgi:hypothetical protein
MRLWPAVAATVIVWTALENLWFDFAFLVFALDCVNNISDTTAAKFFSAMPCLRKIPAKRTW